MIVTIEEANAQLAYLLEKAASGEEVTIAREGASAIRLMPVAMPEAEQVVTPARVPGLGKGEV